MKTIAISALALAAFFTANSANAEQLNVVCSNEQAWCDLMAQNFKIDTGIDAAMVRKSTGEVLAQLRAEKGNPKVDVWWGGTGDPHIIAANEDLTVATGVDVSGLLGWARNMTEMTGGRAVGVHVGLLGFAYNKEFLAEKKIAPPACWRDLAKPEYKGEIQVANPNSSGTAYTELATLVQLFGEDEAYKLLAEIGANVNQYTKSGSAPTKAAARGETAIGIGFMHDMVKLKKEGFPIEIVAPCEGTGYELGAVSVVKGTPNLEAAKKWVEYVISAEGQSPGLEVGVYNIPSHPDAKTDPEAPSMASIKLIDYNFATYGASETRERLLARWEKDVKGAGGAVEN
ncbi:iron ABC transporter substrate-binding protein (plasmid) [Neorhizobium sp. SOG26]|jgi:ABC-type Fe3+ transport system, periplasmic component|uniref:ABC transporter substrate-binding protein n=1 Tax=Neorhizobium turbinariae TaxID=2937795 RepID=A0ABT0INL3_9HYPH|nr:MULTISPECIES: ABC transporter substrate-binding protein [Neorhizobium]AXV18099.1 iron ABC transporter substrate-binding protein [Neorhizobium sp. SOG26]MCK8779450.1 ABC transporter substrate-binding protein [Neorhizobium turbinariae]